MSKFDVNVDVAVTTLKSASVAIGIEILLKISLRIVRRRYHCQDMLRYVKIRRGMEMYVKIC